MKLSSRQKILGGLVVSGAFLGAFLLLRTPAALPPETPPIPEHASKAPEADRVQATSDEASPAPTAVVVEEVEPLEESPPKTTSELSPQVLATRRMVLAHTPLREPTVADPDSIENQRILQAMVLKALKTVPPPEKTGN